MNCRLRSKCIRIEHTKYRQVAILKEVLDEDGGNPVDVMKNKIDTPYGRAIYSHRMSTVEPVFGHIARIKKLNRFTLRGRETLKPNQIVLQQGNRAEY